MNDKGIYKSDSVNRRDRCQVSRSGEEVVQNWGLIQNTSDYFVCGLCALRVLLRSGKLGVRPGKLKTYTILRYNNHLIDHTPLFDYMAW
jgi:hypothetical protein